MKKKSKGAKPKFKKRLKNFFKKIGDFLYWNVWNNVCEFFSNLTFDDVVMFFCGVTLILLSIIMIFLFGYMVLGVFGVIDFSFTVSPPPPPPQNIPVS